MAKKSEFPKETGGGWYELSNGEKVQGEDDAKQAQSDLDSGGGDAPKGGVKTVDQPESGQPGAPKTDDGRDAPNAIGGESDTNQNPSRHGASTVDGMTGALEQGEAKDPEIDGTSATPKFQSAGNGDGERRTIGAPGTARRGLPEGSAGPGEDGKVEDEGTFNALLPPLPTDQALEEHERTRDEWSQIDEDDYDGSPADRVKLRGSQTPAPGTDQTTTNTDEN